MSNIAKRPKAEIIVPNCEIHPTGLVFSEKLTFDEWEETGKLLAKVEGSTLWWIGDWLNEGEKKWGEKYKEAEEKTGLAYGSLKHAKYASERIQLGRRRPNLGWAHHKEVMFLDEGDQEKWLRRAEDNELSVADLRREIKTEKQDRNILKPIDGEHEVIVIDPPWPYGTEYDKDARRVASPYPELSIEKLEAFNLPASANCVLWLWTTHRFLQDSFRLIETWGFEYKICFVWNKEKMGMGAWLRCQVEFCLLAIKGQPRWNLTNERDILAESRGPHSAKPDGFYKMVEALCPTNGTRADIFARKEREGWKVFGNEV